MSINIETNACGDVIVATLDRDVDAIKHEVNAMTAELAQLNDELQGIVARDWTTHGDLARLREELRSTIDVAANLVGNDRRRNLDDLINVVLGK